MSAQRSERIPRAHFDFMACRPSGREQEEEAEEVMLVRGLRQTERAGSDETGSAADDR